jgi:penicillin amidase
MRVLLRILRLLLVVIVIVGLLLSGGLWLFVQRTLPQTSGMLSVSGLANKVEVIRDTWGVPHIYAQSLDDLFFAQGYVMAQDRLWQMEFNRRVGAGRISEFAGKSTLKQDILLRALGLHRSAEADVQHLDASSKQALEAYARGVNAFVETHRDRLPLEFAVLNTAGGAIIQC